MIVPEFPRIIPRLFLYRKKELPARTAPGQTPHRCERPRCAAYSPQPPQGDAGGTSSALLASIFLCIAYGRSDTAQRTPSGDGGSPASRFSFPPAPCSPPHTDITRPRKPMGVRRRWRGRRSPSAERSKSSPAPAHWKAVRPRIPAATAAIISWDSGWMRTALSGWPGAIRAVPAIPAKTRARSSTRRKRMK